MMRSKCLLILGTFLLGAVLCGCQKDSGLETPVEVEQAASKGNEPESQAVTEGIPESEETLEPEGILFTEAVQGGPYGKITISLPDGWSFEACPMDSEKLYSGIYGIHFCPQDVEEGYIELAYTDFFGVCGTGLKSEESQIAGCQVSIGTYDDHDCWDFISFQDEYKGIVAYTYLTEGWGAKYHEQVWEILDTLVFEPEEREGGAYVYHEESELTELGLYFSLKNISPSGATLVFHQYDQEAPSGEVEFGDDFQIEVYQDGEWENVPIVVQGNYAFHALAYSIAAGQSTEKDLDWEWLYGKLPSGEYRIRKEIHDFRGTGDFDKYSVFAHFILN